MRRVLRAAIKEDGVERVAFVCGAYHAPALDPAALPAQARDNELLAGLPKDEGRRHLGAVDVGPAGLRQRVRRRGDVARAGTSTSSTTGAASRTTTRSPRAGWSASRGRCAASSSTPRPPRSSRPPGWPTALAAVRGRPSVGLSELDDAAEAVLCEGSRRAAGPRPRLAGRRSRAGRRARSEHRWSRSPRTSSASSGRCGSSPPRRRRRSSLDLRRESQLARSVLLHRLRLLGVDWGTRGRRRAARRARSRRPGSSSGTRSSRWRVIEAGLYGTTVAAAAAAKVTDDRGPLRRPRHPRAAGLASACSPTCPRGCARSSPRSRSARPGSTTSWRCSVPSSRWRGRCRYGDVRGVDVGGVAQVLRAVVVRAAVGLPRRVRRPRRRRPPPRSATASRAPTAAWRCWTTRSCAAAGCRVARGRRGARPACTARWPAGSTGCCSTPAGSTEADAATPDEPAAVRRRARRRRRRLARRVPRRARRCCWSTTRPCSAIVDEWVSGIAEATFEDLLPLLRRTFSRFQPPERRLDRAQVARARRRGSGVGRRRPSGSTSSAARPGGGPGRRGCSGWGWPMT